MNHDLIDKYLDAMAMMAHRNVFWAILLMMLIITAVEAVVFVWLVLAVATYGATFVATLVWALWSIYREANK